MANIYFLIIMVLQLIKPISISQGQPAILLPLFFVVLVSGIKDALEDRKRHQSDDHENNSKTELLSPSGLWEPSQWKLLKIGKIIKVYEDQYFPADLLLLQSSSESGLCYIETKSLDGETNMKHKVCHKDMLT
jgi:P-type E1-E2 ATPase